MAIDFDNLLCPADADTDIITMAHGAGGKQTAKLIEDVFLSKLANIHLERQEDSAVLSFGDVHLAFTTDSYVINPLFFPGGNIGSLAVTGTINDLAMMGAKPKYLSLAIILEEGFPKQKLNAVVESISATAESAGVAIVTGDTKVVNAGKGDGIFINTSGIGLIDSLPYPNPSRIKMGDAIIVSGDIGRHGCAVMASREGINFETNLQSDMACLHEVVNDLLAADIDLHCLRDLTRGGLATSVIEIAQRAKVHIEIEENSVPVIEPVSSLCNILGLDPMFVANEGRFVLVVPDEDSNRTLEILSRHEASKNAKKIGAVVKELSDIEQVKADVGISDSEITLEQNTSRNNKPQGFVTLKTAFGTRRHLDKLSGDQLPRIC